MAKKKRVKWYNLAYSDDDSRTVQITLKEFEKESDRP